MKNCPSPAFVVEPNATEALPANTAAVALRTFCHNTDCWRQLSALLKEASAEQASLSFAMPRRSMRQITDDQGGERLSCCVWTVPSIDYQHADRDRMMIYVLIEGDADFERFLESSIAREVFWDEYARSYDRVLPLLSYYQIAVDRHISAMVQAGARKILDLGAGTGNVALPLAKRGCYVTLVDTSAAMLGRAREKASADNLVHQMEFLEQSAEDIGDLSADSFDAINVLLAAFCMDDAARALEHAVRVVRSGGLLVFTEPVRAFNEEPLIEAGEAELKGRSDWSELQFDWQVVANAGHRLGQLIRQLKDTSPPGSPAESTERKLRADEVPGELERLGCAIETNIDSHLGQCRHIVARKSPHAAAPR